MPVRAIFEACHIDGHPAPYDTAHLKLFYPSAPEDSDAQRNMGFVPALETEQPFPVVIFMHGTNVPVEGYSWLAKALAEQGIVTVLYSWVKEDMPGFVCQSPGIDIDAMRPENFGSRPTASALPALYSRLQAINTDDSNLLAGRLNLNNIVIGGHSAGGSVALLNARHEWFPWLGGVFSYGAHTAASTLIGYPPDTLLPVATDVPVMIVAGGRDGVIAASGFRYGDGEEAPATARIERCFEESVSRDRGDSIYAVLTGANHFTAVEPKDGTTGRDFLDWPEEADGDALREVFATLVQGFVNGLVHGQGDQREALKQTLKTHHLITDPRIK